MTVGEAIKKLAELPYDMELRIYSEWAVTAEFSPYWPVVEFNVVYCEALEHGIVEVR